MKKRKKVKKDNFFLINLFKGMVVGVGFIAPGVSGGVIAVILGIYDKIIYAINNLKKSFKENFGFLFSVILGILIGVVLFSKLLLYLLEVRSGPIKFVFTGLILGGIPVLIKNIKKEKPNEKLSGILILSTLFFSFFLAFIEKNNIFTFANGGNNIFLLILVGFCYSAGKIIPGVSGSALLMFLGVYEKFLKIISNPFSLQSKEISELIIILVSFIISSIIIFKLINYLLKKHYIKTYSAILGFVIGSIVFIFPGFSHSLADILNIILLILGALFAYLISN